MVPAVASADPQLLARRCHARPTRSAGRPHVPSGSGRGMPRETSTDPTEYVASHAEPLPHTAPFTRPCRGGLVAWRAMVHCMAVETAADAVG
jgi:hypothetical protein